jgi:hypothetical protein
MSHKATETRRITKKQGMAAEGVANCDTSFLAQNRLFWRFISKFHPDFQIV